MAHNKNTQDKKKWHIKIEWPNSSRKKDGAGGGGHLLFTDDVSLALSESWFARPYKNGMFVRGCE